jgi:hypothetical protein
MPVDFASVAYLDYQHHEPVVLNSANDAKIAHPVAPASPQRPGQAIAYLPWIIKRRQTALKEIFDSASVLRVKLCH